MADVFLSYSRQDKAIAARFVEMLEGLGWDVFWDQETRAGTLWPKVLEDELNQARCLLVLWTSHSVASRWVRIEAYEALQNEKLLPVRLENVKPPLEFRQTQLFDLIGWTGEPADPRLPRLFEDLAAIAKCAPPRRGRPAAVASDVRAAEPPPPARSRPTAREPVALPLQAETATVVADPEVVVAVASPPAPPVMAPAPVARAAESPVETRSWVREQDAAAAAAEPVATTLDPEPVDRAARADWAMPRARTALIAGTVVAAIAAAWLLRTAMTSGEAPPGPAPAPEVVAPAAPKSSPEPAPAEVKASAAKIEPAPVRSIAPAAPTITPADNKAAPATPTPARVASGAARAASARCIDIAEKFQTTGQLTDEERRFLSSKECAK